MPKFRESLSLPPELNREEIKNYVIQCFLKEQAGTGKGSQCSKYIYEVESCRDRKIFLRRPATLNKGMDFTVHVEGIKFREKYAYKDRPKHKEIILDLQAKKKASPEKYILIAEYLHNIYKCLPYDELSLRDLEIKAGLLTCEECCLAVKWLFIEQDVTYWNWSGRAMFYGALTKHNLVSTIRQHDHADYR